MATSQTPITPSVTGAATPPGTDPNTDDHTPATAIIPATAPPQARPRGDPTSQEVPTGASAADRALMRARLAAMATPRDSDSPRLAKLRAVLRDESLMAHVRANVEEWPPLTDEQRDTLAALLNRHAKRRASRRAA